MLPNRLQLALQLSSVGPISYLSEIQLRGNNTRSHYFITKDYVTVYHAFWYTAWAGFTISVNRTTNACALKRPRSGIYRLRICRWSIYDVATRRERRKPNLSGSHLSTKVKQGQASLVYLESWMEKPCCLFSLLLLNLRLWLFASCGGAPFFFFFSASWSLFLICAFRKVSSPYFLF